MKQTIQPIVKDLVLLGGGHSHAIALRLFGMHPLPGVRITLLTEASDTPYSGMLPGHVAGFYTREECYIDLRSLAQFAQAQLYIDRAIGLDLDQNRILCQHRPPVAFDLLSIDIGSTPKLPAGLGDCEAIIPAKPVSQFLQQWEDLVAQVRQQPDQPICLGIVGGGAGGVELALTMQHRLQAVLRAANQPVEHLTLHLFHRGAELMPNHNRWVRHHLRNLLTQRGIQLHLQETVAEVQPRQIRCESGLRVMCDRIFWVTQASAPNWLGKAGLEVDGEGFVLVDETLRSLSHAQVFAAGDIATMTHHPRPKAGVFAVRQGKPLYENLRRTLQQQPLQPFQPQKQYLSLIGTGDGCAIASRGSWGWRSPLLWQWKEHIDRTFMQKFNHLPEMGKGRSQESGVKSQESGESMRCAGCGAKVGNTILEKVLQRIQNTPPEKQATKFNSLSEILDTARDSTSPLPIPESPHSPLALYPDPSSPHSSPLRAPRTLCQHSSPPHFPILLGLNSPDDAAVFQIPVGRVLVQTIDYFPALLQDPFLFGQIATNHALSDLYAMGAEPHSALAIATIPYAHAAAIEETLYQLLSGAVTVLQEAGAELIGGHTTEGAELAFGLSCNGLADPEQLLRKVGMQPGQALILTKAIGTGTLFAAQMQRQVKGQWIDHAIASMCQSNYPAAQCFLAHRATACTDITGFGLLGHLLEMLRASGVAVELNLSAIPLLEGALATVQKGIVSSLQAQNLQAARFIESSSQLENHPEFSLLFDPQTAGGLLASVPLTESDRCLTALKHLGYPYSAIIGHTVPLKDSAKPIVIAAKLP